MELFIDSADLEQVRQAATLGVIRGCTTNPKLAATSGVGDFRDRVLQILQLISGPVSVEVTAEDAEGMLAQAIEFSRWDERVVVKIPMSAAGLEVTSRLEGKHDIRVNVTCMMNSNQATLALLAGASYVSLFVGRINDLGYDADSTLRETAHFIDQGGFSARIIAASMRGVADIQRSFLAGAHIVTIPHRFLAEMIHRPRTIETIDEFKQAWDNRD